MHRRRRGVFNSMELIVALAVLTVAAVGIGRFVTSVHSGLRELEDQSRLQWELTNARERIGCWRVDHISRERIAQLPISSELSQAYSNLAWRARVQPIEEPHEALQVELSMHGEYRGQPAVLSEITFWEFEEATGGEDDEP